MTEQGKTIVRYGALEIHGLATGRFSQEPIWDNARLNQIGTKFTYEGVGLVHDYLDFAQPHCDPVPAGADAAEAERNIRRIAMTPRQSLTVTIGADSDGGGGTVLLEAHPFAEGLKRFRNISKKDLDNGPRCEQIDIVLVNAKVMRVQFQFSAVIAECDSQGNNSNNSTILSNTWSCDDSYDKNLMLTRRWVGQLHLSTAQINPHSFRGWCLPVLEDSCYRDSMTFRASEDGRILHYTIVDKQGYCSPVPPATEFTSPLRATYSTGSGKISFIEASVGLAGDPHADKRNLLSLAVQLVESKCLALDGALRDKDGKKLVSTIENFTVVEEISDRVSNVFVSCVAMRPVVGTDYNSLLDEAFGKDPREQVLFGHTRASNGGNVSREILLWDTQKYRGNWDIGFAGPDGNKGDALEVEGAVTAVSALSTFLQSPCDVDHNIKDGMKGREVGVVRKKPATKIKAYKSKDIKRVGKFTSHVNNEHTSSMYVHWEMESKFEANQLQVQMPIARFDADSPTSAGKPSSAFIALGPEQWQRRIRYKGKRIGKSPEVPVPKSFKDQKTGINYILLNHDIRQATPDYTAGGKTIWSRSGEIVYGMDRPPQSGQSLPIGYNPYDVLGLVRADNPTNNKFDEGPPVV